MIETRLVQVENANLSIVFRELEKLISTKFSQAAKALAPILVTEFGNSRNLYHS